MLTSYKNYTLEEFLDFAGFGEEFNSYATKAWFGHLSVEEMEEDFKLVGYSGPLPMISTISGKKYLTAISPDGKYMLKYSRDRIRIWGDFPENAKKDLVWASFSS